MIKITNWNSLSLVFVLTITLVYFILTEYAFGGHPYNWSGIFDMTPKAVETLGDDFKFRFVGEYDIHLFIN